MTNAVNKLQQKSNNGGLTDIEKNALEALKNAGKECLKIYDMALSLNRTPFQMKHFNTLKNGGYLVDDKKFAQIANKANQEAKVKDVKINDTDEMMKKATTTKAMKL